jgi:transposase-like protein
MECPVCNKSNRVEIDTHSDGYAENIQECGHCGAVWTRKAGRSIVIYGGTRLAANQ